jgi:hypothetical protein
VDRGLYSPSLVSVAISIVLATLATVLCLEPGIAQIPEVIPSSKRALAVPLAAIERGRASSQTGLVGGAALRTNMPVGHRVGLLDRNRTGIIANPPALLLPGDDVRMISKLERIIADSKSESGVKFTGYRPAE